MNILLKVVLCVFLLPGNMLANASNNSVVYAGPFGSDTNDGTRISPWDFATAATYTTNNSCTLILLDGVYTLSNTTYTLGKIGSHNKIMADTVGGRKRPILDNPVTDANIYLNDGTILEGIWTDEQIIPRNGCRIEFLVNFNTPTNGLILASKKDTVKNSLFVNVGRRNLWHSIYASAICSNDSGYYIHRNVIVAGDSAKNTSAYAIQFWHGASPGKIDKNFVGGTSYALAFGEDGGESHARHGDIRDNVFWSNRVQPLFFFSGSDTVLFRHNLTGKFITYWGFGGAGNGNIIDSNYWCWPIDQTRWNYDPGTYHGGTNSTLWSYSNAMKYIGIDSSSVDTTVERLARTFYGKSVSQVYADTSILTYWQKLINTVDFFQGTIEESVKSLPAETPVPVFEFYRSSAVVNIYNFSLK